MISPFAYSSDTHYIYSCKTSNKEHSLSYFKYIVSIRNCSLPQVLTNTAVLESSASL